MDLEEGFVDVTQVASEYVDGPVEYVDGFSEFEVCDLRTS